MNHEFTCTSCSSELPACYILADQVCAMCAAGSELARAGYDSNAVAGDEPVSYAER